MHDYDIKVANSWQDLATHYRDNKRIAFMLVNHTLLLGRTHAQTEAHFRVTDNEVEGAGLFSSSGIEFVTSSRLSDFPVRSEDRPAVRAAIAECKVNFGKVRQ